MTPGSLGTGAVIGIVAAAAIVFGNPPVELQVGETVIACETLETVDLGIGEVRFRCQRAGGSSALIVVPLAPPGCGSDRAALIESQIHIVGKSVAICISCMNRAALTQRPVARIGVAAPGGLPP